MLLSTNVRDIQGSHSDCGASLAQYTIMLKEHNDGYNIAQFILIPVMKNNLHDSFKFVFTKLILKSEFWKWDRINVSFISFRTIIFNINFSNYYFHQ